MPTDAQPTNGETEAFIRERAAKGDRAAFLRLLDEAADEPPADGDKIAEN